MLDIIPEALHHEIVDGFASPKTRQSWAGVNNEARRLTQQSDTAYYKKWLRDDFARDSPVDSKPSAKDAYRAHLEVSRQETARLLKLAQGDEISQFISGITDVGTQERLSNRYGKRPLAQAGLLLTQRLAQPRAPDESPPRLREGELAALEDATRMMHDLSGTEKTVGNNTRFSHNLRSAAEQAEQRSTRATCPEKGPPPAPRRKRMAKLYPR